MRVTWLLYNFLELQVHNLHDLENISVFNPSHAKLYSHPMPGVGGGGGGGGGGGRVGLSFLNSLCQELNILQAIRTLLENFKKVKMDEISFVWLPRQPANVQVLFANFGLKTISFLNGHKNFRCKAITLKHSELIALFMLNLKN